MSDKIVRQSVFLFFRNAGSRRALRLNRGLKNTNLHAFRQFDKERVVPHLAHRTEKSSDSDDLIATADAAYQRIVLFLALALVAQASTIVSGDADLLTLGVWRGIDIHTPAQYLAQVA